MNKRKRHAFVSAMAAPTTTTEKGAVSLATSGSARVDLFFKAVRDLTGDSLRQYLSASWLEDPLDTLKIIFQTRDCRGSGKGERKLFQEMMAWLQTVHPESVKNNLHLVPLYGRWDDVLLIPGGVDFIASQLKKDLAELEDKKDQARISLAAKWCPTENHALDRKFRVVDKIVRALGRDVSRQDYRKKYLTPLRSYLKIVETAMCTHQWETINYSKVPSKAMKNYKKAFKRHDPTGFERWITALQRDDKKTDDGEIVKVNAKQLYPHELVSEYYKGAAVNPVTEEQWKVLQEDLAVSGNFEKSVCLCDVSGSMQGEPIQVCISLGILLSSVTKEPFKGSIITFETKPQFIKLTGNTLQENVQQLAKAPWNGSTNLQAAFDLILDRATLYNVPAEDMPTRLYIFSDMQFDAACNSNTQTNFQTMQRKFEQAGYQLPQVIFWNLRATANPSVASLTKGSNEMPVAANEQGVALLSGFSASLLKSFLDGTDLTPYGVLRTVLDDPRYDPITYSGEDNDDWTDAVVIS